MPPALDVFRARPVRAFILDITGVLYNSAENTDGNAIPGSIETVKRYIESVGLQVKFSLKALRRKQGGFSEQREHRHSDASSRETHKGGILSPLR